MFSLTDISVDFLTGSPAVVGLALLALLVLSFLLYRHTNPPLPVYLRILLGALRVIAVLALLAALSEPVISYTQEFERTRRVSLLIDRSASMDSEEDGRSRTARVDSLLGLPEFERLRSSGDVSQYFFAGNLATSPAEVAAEETALGLVLKELDRRELAEPADYWLLLTDGNSNSGPRPIEAAALLRVPLTTVDMSTGHGDLDAGISQVDNNSVIYVGRPTEVGVKVGWRGVGGGALTVQLLDSGRVVAEEQQTIDQEAGFADVTLRYVPDRPGQRLLQIRVPPLVGETNESNNSRTVSVKVLKSRVVVLLVTGGPDYEVGFLHRFLSQSDRYEVDLVVTGSRSGNLRGRFPERQAELNRYDLVVLHDPRSDLFSTQRTLLRSYLAERGGGLWVTMGRRFTERPLERAVEELLPFYPSGRTEAIYSQFHGIPAEGQLFHPAVRIADSRATIRETWADLPPFRMLVPCDRAAPDAVTLVYAGDSFEDRQRVPVLGYHRLGPGKVMVSAAQPWWTWGFETLAYGGDHTVYERFLEGTIRWLTVPEDFDPIRIRPEKEVFTRGESVRFEGFAFDQGYRPIPDVSGTVVLSGDSAIGEREADMLAGPEGKHEVEFPTLPPGEYAFEGSFVKDGQILKTSRGKVLVESFTLEEYNRQGDPATLAALTRATGGNHFHFTDFTEAVASLDMNPVRESVSREVMLWGKLWLLLVFVSALALEWVLRKLNYLL